MSWILLVLFQFYWWVVVVFFCFFSVVFCVCIFCVFRFLVLVFIKLLIKLALLRVFFLTVLQPLSEILSQRHRHRHHQQHHQQQTENSHREQHWQDWAGCLTSKLRLIRKLTDAQSVNLKTSKLSLNRLKFAAACILDTDKECSLVHVCDSGVNK